MKAVILTIAIGIVILLALATVLLHGAQPAQQRGAAGSIDPTAQRAVPLTSPNLNATTTDAASIAHHIDSIALIGSPFLIINATNKVLITATISDSTLISQSVTLYREVANANAIEIGSMHDDGQNGDLVAGDNTYTIAVDGTSFPTTGTYTLFVTAAFRGALLRAKSQILSLTVSAPLATIDATWQTYSNSSFSIRIPGGWIASSTPGTQSSDPTTTISFSLPTDPSNPVLYIFIYPHGFDVYDKLEEPPNYLASTSTTDFYFMIRNADTDSSVLFPLGLTDSSLNSELLQSVSTFVAR
ncbi:MAG: choice-of-anchor X domain-containing protein [Candidatus Solibacter sp.]|jgi:hypothetical protein